jgi:apolipoprotein N-acyltransferase
VVDPLPVYRQASRDLLRAGKVDLLVWPETAAGRVVREDLLQSFVSSDLLGRRGDDGSRISVPLLTGLFLERAGPDDRKGQATGPPARMNSAVLTGPTGLVLGTYDKRSLVLLGEYLPYEQALPWLRKLLPSAGTLSAGSVATVLALGDTRILPLICFEDILAERVRSDVEATEPDLLINLTSDAWFGESRLAELHLAIAQLRAVEHRRYLVHATSTGVTAVVDAAGRVVTRLPAHVRTSGLATVRSLRSSTLYDELGPWLEYLIAVGLLVLGGLRNRRLVASGDGARPSDVVSVLTCVAHLDLPLREGRS